MKAVSLLALIAIFCVTSSLGLIVYLPTNETLQYDSPEDPIPGWDAVFNVTGKQIFLATDGHACTMKSLEGVGDRIVLATNDRCPGSQRIKNVWKSGAAGLIQIGTKSSAPAGSFWTWNSQDISASEGIKLPTTEISNKDGGDLKKLLEQYPDLTVDMASGDYNAWIQAYQGPAVIFWQLSEAILFFIPLCIAFYKFMIILMRWKGPLVWAFFSTQTFIIYSVIIACTFCFTYVAVDPLHTRGHFNNLADVVLTTLGLPPTLTGTFLMTVIWLTGFNNASVISRKELVLKVSKFFLGVMLIFFVFDLISSFIKGLYINTTNTQYIIGIYYIVAALLVTVFYLVIAIRIKQKVKNIAAEFGEKGAGGTLPGLVRILNRNMWLFALLYGLWILTAAIAITQLVWLPTGRLFIYWFVYFFIALINLCHALLVTTPAASTGKDISGTTMETGNDFSKTARSDAEMESNSE